MVLALAAIKVGWVIGCAPSAPMVPPGDVMARRAHLIARTTSPSFASDHALTPGGIYRSEWQLVTLSMTAAALANIAFERPETRASALDACETVVVRALAPDMRAFEREAWNSDPLDDLEGPKGHVGYLGHLGWMLGIRRVLGGDERHDTLHRRVDDALARRMRASVSRHIETYPGQIYTADNSVGVAALALHDMAAGGRAYADVIAEWAAYTRSVLLDPDNGLTVFGVAADGTARGRGRGSAAGYSALYLPYVDASFAAEQRARLRAHMEVALPFGALGVREYARGAGAGGDVDSGPLVFGVSPAATGFALAAARHDGDDAWARGLLRTAEIAGFSVPCRGGRCYLLAPLVGDAIVLAMRTALLWDARHVRR